MYSLFFNYGNNVSINYGIYFDFFVASICFYSIIKLLKIFKLRENNKGGIQ